MDVGVGRITPQVRAHVQPLPASTDGGVRGLDVHPVTAIHVDRGSIYVAEPAVGKVRSRGKKPLRPQRGGTLPVAGDISVGRTDPAAACRENARRLRAVDNDIDVVQGHHPGLRDDTVTSSPYCLDGTGGQPDFPAIARHRPQELSAPVPLITNLVPSKRPVASAAITPSASSFVLMSVPPPDSDVAKRITYIHCGPPSV